VVCRRPHRHSLSKDAWRIAQVLATLMLELKTGTLFFIVFGFYDTFKYLHLLKEICVTVEILMVRMDWQVGGH